MLRTVTTTPLGPGQSGAGSATTFGAANSVRSPERFAATCPPNVPLTFAVTIVYSALTFVVTGPSVSFRLVFSWTLPSLFWVQVRSKASGVDDAQVNSPVVALMTQRLIS